MSAAERRHRRAARPNRGASPASVERRITPVSDSFLESVSYVEAFDADHGDPDKDALGAILMALVEELPAFQRTILETYLFQVRGAELDPRHGSDSGLRATARAVGENPHTGKQVDKNTVKRHLELALAALRERINELPEWQRGVVARSLVEGTIPTGDVLVVAEGLLPQLPSWVGELE